MEVTTVIIVFGASGDLAYKKTYPALFGLYNKNLLQKNTKIVGYARSQMTLPEFKSRISSKVSLSADFLENCYYVSGGYDDPDSYKKLHDFTSQWNPRNTLFYMALPPSVFIPASYNIRDFLYSQGSNRLIVEKPFGKDLESAQILSNALKGKWNESEIYRIDHYLGKEMVKNLMILRFANIFFSAVWNCHYISNIQITFKEAIGTQGRGGYFDEFGIIRDVLQNHLLQILTIIAMEKPVSKNADDIRDEKVKVLKAIKPLSLDHTILGQYVGSIDGKEPGYLDDKTVPKGSITPTFATVVLYCNNERWDGNISEKSYQLGVPFIIKAGKALNESKAEVRIQFKDVPGDLFSGISRNELVIRVQPQESVYLKFMNKKPGLSSTPLISELDLTYKHRYSDHDIPDAYESLILDALNGDKSHFVRDDELEAAWKIFTPLLHEIEEKRIKPIPYIFGTRGPQEATDFIKNLGYIRQEEYAWSPSRM